MNCCTDCFSDKELIAFIYSNSNTNGSCEFCGARNVDTISSQELQDQFVSLFDIYSIDKDGINLVTALQDDWKIFKINDVNKINSLLFSIVDGLDDHYTELLNSNVSISIQSETLELIENWNSFKQEIKKENRFFY
jgi:hypothetical protein